MLKLGWFSTGRGEGSRNLFITVYRAIARGEIDADIQFVFTNRDPGEAEGSDRFQQLVENLHIPLVCFSSRKFKHNWTGDPAQRRNAYDMQVMNRLRGYRPDLCVLAGYMLIVGPEMCNRYTMINLHPAAPDGPQGTWQEVIWELIQQRATHSGIKVHIVTEELDRGPTLTYCTYPLRKGDLDREWKAVEGKSVDQLQNEYGEGLSLFKLIRQEGARRELPLIVETLKALANGDIKLDRSRPLKPRDLTDAVERAIGHI